MRHRLRLLLVILGFTLVISVLGIAPAFAAKGSGSHTGGGGGKHGGGTSSTATLLISPASPTANSTIAVSGCGYLVNVPAEIGYVTPTAATVGGITVDSNGCFATSLYVSGSGSYSIGVQQYVNNSWVVEASIAFTVQ
ncbi:MAG TPA: hypothetical protein VFU72_13780 [Nitrolancea sp.]|nr:hypothetical protein [Nitrolancea sp.]